MDVRQQLLKVNSRANADLVEDFVVLNQHRLVDLMACFLSHDRIVAQRAAQVVGNLGRTHPDWLMPWWEPMLDAAETPAHVATRRNVARYFSELPISIPAAIEKKIARTFADWILDAEVPVAVAVFAMQFIADRADRYPNETLAVVQTIRKKLPDATPGFINRAIKTLRQLGMEP